MRLFLGRDPFDKLEGKPHAYDSSVFNRFATVLIYLQTADAGGGTRFCKYEDLVYQPKPYSALFWYNLDYAKANAEWTEFAKTEPTPEQVEHFWQARPNAMPRDVRFEHAGLPVDSGSKWILNKYVPKSTCIISGQFFFLCRWFHYRRHPSAVGQMLP